MNEDRSRAAAAVLRHTFCAKPAPGREKLLRPGEALNTRSGLAFERKLIGSISDGESSEVADVFTQRESSIDMQVVNGIVGILLLDEFLRAHPLPSTSRPSPSERRP